MISNIRKVGVNEEDAGVKISEGIGLMWLTPNSLEKSRSKRRLIDLAMFMLLLY